MIICTILLRELIFVSLLEFVCRVRNGNLKLKWSFRHGNRRNYIKKHVAVKNCLVFSSVGGKSTTIVCFLIHSSVMWKCVNFVIDQKGHGIPDSLIKKVLDARSF